MPAKQTGPAKQAKQAKPRGTKAYKAKQRGASHAGFHFHNLYQCCQMKWFIRFLLRIEPKHIAPPLVNGHAFHEGKATFYQTGSEAKAIRKVITEIQSRQSELQYQEDYDTMLERCPTLLKHWIITFGRNDLKRFDLVAVEKEIILPVPGTSFLFTMRIDAVVDEKTGDKDRYILETKTSSFSINTTELGVYYGDQATTYMWGAREAFGKPVYGVIPDIAYWNKNAKDSSNIKCVRGDIIQRSDRRINQFLNGIAQLQTEIAQKVEAYKNGYDPYTLFQRNTYYCNSFFKACEFAEICDNNLCNVKRLPPGYKKGRTFIKPKSFGYVEDSASGLL